MAVRYYCASDRVVSRELMLSLRCDAQGVTTTCMWRRGEECLSAQMALESPMAVVQGELAATTCREGRDEECLPALVALESAIASSQDDYAMDRVAAMCRRGCDEGVLQAPAALESPAAHVHDDGATDLAGATYLRGRGEECPPSWRCFLDGIDLAAMSTVSRRYSEIALGLYIVHCRELAGPVSSVSDSSYNSGDSDCDEYGDG